MSGSEVPKTFFEATLVRIRHMRHRLNFTSDVFWPWLLATLFSGVPSTVFFLATGQPLWPPVHAVGSMLVSSNAAPWLIFLAAAAVHCAVSLFWTIVVVCILPAKHVVLWALGASGLIAVLDLRIIAPLFFPEVARLSFWPQFADHLAWGLLVGMMLQWRRPEIRTGSAHRNNSAH
jgi:hypothetical protein